MSLPWEAREDGGLWTPRADPSALLWWDPSTLAAGAVSSWTDRIAGVAATQGTGSAQPTASATAIGSAYPGVTSDGGDALSAATGAVLSGKTTLTIVAAMVDATAGVGSIIEHTAAPFSTDGGVGLVANGTAAGRVDCTIRGTSSYTNQWIAQALGTAVVVSAVVHFATAGAGAVVAMRVNGVAQSMTASSSASAAGSAANASTYFFARNAASVWWPGTLGNIVIRNSISTGADLTAVERYVGRMAGITI